MRSFLVLLLVILVLGGLAGLAYFFSADSTATPIVMPTAVDSPEEARTSPALESPTQTSGGQAVPTPTASGRENLTPVSSGTGDQAATPSGPNRLTGVVVDDGGNAVPGAEVTLTRAVDAFFSAPMTSEDDPTEKCDADGKFVFTGVEPYDHYTLVARHPEYSRGMLDGIRVGAHGEFRAPTEIKLGKGSRLTGQVIDESDNPVAGAELRLGARQLILPGVSDADAVTTTSDEMGRYEFQGVSPNLAHLRVSAPGFGTVASSGFDFRNGRSANRDIVLLEAAKIGGRVVDQSGAPVAGARLIAFGQARRPADKPAFRTKRVTPLSMLVSGADGSFLFDTLETGVYSLSVQADGYRMDRQHSQIETGELNLTIQLLTRATVSGRVIGGSGGTPVAGGSVQLRFANKHSTVTTPTPHKGVIQADGTFSITNVSKGTYLVQGDSQGYAPSYSGQFTVIEGQSVPGIEVVLQTGGSIVGRLTGTDGAPVAGASITTQDATYTDDVFTRSLGSMMPTDATTRAVSSGADGTFEVPGLHPAKYQIRVQAPGKALFIKADIEVRQGVRTEIGDIVVQSGGSVTGLVLTAENKPSAGTKIRLQRTEHSFTNPLMFETTTDGTGKFSFAGINEGTYRLQAVRKKPGGLADIFGEMQTQTQSTVQIVVNNGKQVQKDLRLDP